jgi:hypothetical protein
MEDPSYESFSLATLKRLASAFDVAFVGRFVAFSELVDWATNLTAEHLAPPEFGCDQLRCEKQETSSERNSLPTSSTANINARHPIAPKKPSPWAERGGVLGALADDKAQDRARYASAFYGGAIENGACGALQQTQG